MIAQERHEIILQMLRQNRVIKIADIVAKFDISNLTARRDLDFLQDQNLVHRVYGGAILVDGGEEAPPSTKSTASRYRSQRADISAIGKLSASMIQEGDVIFLGTGSTALAVAKNMHQFSNVTVVTNSLPVLNELSSARNRVYSTGGALDADEQCFMGPLASATITSLYADKAFVGCAGISPDYGISDYSETVADIDRLMIQNSKQSFIVASSRKFGVKAFSYVCPLRGIHALITDEYLSEQYLDYLKQTDLQVHLAKISKENSTAMGAE